MGDRVTEATSRIRPLSLPFSSPCGDHLGAAKDSSWTSRLRVEPSKARCPVKSESMAGITLSRGKDRCVCYILNPKHSKGPTPQHLKVLSGRFLWVLRGTPTLNPNPFPVILNAPPPPPPPPPPRPKRNSEWVLILFLQIAAT